MIVKVSNLSIANTLIKLGVVINVMTKYTLEKFGLSGLRLLPTILQLAYHSTFKPEGVEDDIIVSIDLWEISS